MMRDIPHQVLPGRPAEIRTALEATLRQAGPLPLVELAAKAQVGYKAARRAVHYGKVTGKLQVVGHEKRPHCTKWVALYDVAPEPERQASSPVVLGLNALGELIATQWRQGVE